MVKGGGASRKAAKATKDNMKRPMREGMDKKSCSNRLAQPKRPMRRVKLLTVYWAVMGGYETGEKILSKEESRLEQYEHLQSRCYTEAR